MQLNYIGIRNVLGIKSLECKPGKITSIDGPNGSGKTSFLKALKAAVGGGHDATLLRQGEEEGEIVLEFDNGMKLTKKIGKEKSDITLKDASGVKVKKAASLLKGIVDGVGLNPIQLLTATKKDRVSILLESVPMELPVDRLEKECGYSVFADDDRHPIEVIEAVRSNIFDLRADKNRDIKSKKGMIEQMQEAIPFASTFENYSTIAETLANEKTVLHSKAQSDSFSIKEEFASLSTQCDADTSKEVEAIKDEATKSITLLRERQTKELEKLRIKMDDEVQAVMDKALPVLEDLTAKIAQAKEKAEVQIKAKAATEFIEEGEKDLDVLELVSKSYTTKLQAVDDIKAELLAGFPIDGLTVVDGDTYLNDIDFDNVNEALRIRFALQVAGLRESELPLVCVDGLEALDDGSFHIFCDEAVKTDMQFFVTRVTNDDRLNMTTFGKPE